MPYTAAQLAQYYTSVNQGQAPDQATTLQFQAAAQQNANGSLTDAQTLAFALNSAQVRATTDVATATYQFFTGSVPTAAGYTYLVNNAGTGFNTAYFNGSTGTATAPSTGGFDVENRYFNESIALATNTTTGAAFVSSYGSLTVNQTIAAAYETIIGTSNVGQANANAAIASIQSSVGYFTQIAQQRAGGVDVGGAAGQNIALKAIIVGYILEEGIKADTGTYAKAIDQFNASIAAGNAIYGSNVLTTYGPGGTGFGTGIGATSSGIGQTIALTTGTDTLTQQTGGNITYVGSVGAGATLNPADVIQATGANNTLLVTTTAATTDITGGALISGIQTLNIRNTGMGTTAAFNGNSIPNVGTVNAYLSAGNVTATNVSGTTSIGVVGNSVVANGDVAATFVAAATQATVNLVNGVSQGNITLTDGGMQNLGGIVVNSTGAANTLTSLADVSGNVTSLTLNATSALATGTVTAAALTNLNVTGTATVTIAAGTPIVAPTVSDTNTAGLTATFSALKTFTGTTGTDVITVTNALTNKANISTGGGSDVVTLGSTVAAGATVNGGGGGTLNLTAATATTVTSTGFATPTGTQTQAQADAAADALISGFTTLGITNATGTVTISPSAISATSVNLLGGVTNGQTTTVVLGANSTLGLAGDLATANGGVIVTGATAFNTASTPSDSLTINYLSKGNGVTTTAATTAIQIDGIETVTVNNSDAAGATINLAQAAGANTATLATLTIAASKATTLGATTTDTSLATVNVSGAGTFTYTANAANKALVTVNASGSTGVDTIDISAIASTSATAITLTSGSKADVLTFKDFAIVTGGAGADTFNAGVTTSGQTYSTITDAAAGDIVKLSGATSSVAAKIVLAGTAVFQDYLDAATAGNATHVESAFDFGGNTYVVVDNAAGTTFSSGVDSVVKLTGIHVLTATLGVLGS